MSASPINTGLSRSNLERFWPLWLSFAIAWLLGLVLPLAIMVPAAGEYAAAMMPMGWTAEYVASLIGCAVASVAAVCFVFEYLFNQSSAIFHGSLPIKRSSLFLSTYVSGLLPLIAIEIVVAFVLMIFAGVYPAVEAVNVWCWLVLTVGFTFIFFNLAAFCAVLTGERSMTISLFVFANFFIVFVEGFLRVIASMMLWGVSMFDTFKTMWTSPFVGLWNYCINGGKAVVTTGVNDISFLALGAYCLVALALLVAAVVLNNRRDFERAGSSTAFEGVRIFCKYVAGVSGALFCGLLVVFFVGVSYGVAEEVLSTGRVILVTVFMILGGFLGLFFAEVAMGKSMRVLSKCWKGAIVLAVLSTAFMAGCSMDVLHTESYVPKASEVKSVQLNNDITLEEEKNIELATALHQQIIDCGYRAHSENMVSDSFDIKYTLKDGTIVSRNYTVYSADSSDDSGRSDEVKQILKSAEAACNCEEGLKSRLSSFVDKPAGSVSVTVVKGAAEENENEATFLNSSDVQEFVTGPLMKDILENGLGKMEFGTVYNGSSYQEETVIYTVELQNNQTGDESRFQSLELTKSNCPNVAKWLRDHYKLHIVK